MKIEEFLFIDEKGYVYLGEIRGVFIVEGKENLGFEIFSEVLCLRPKSPGLNSTIT